MPNLSRLMTVILLGTASMAGAADGSYEKIEDFRIWFPKAPLYNTHEGTGDAAGLYWKIWTASYQGVEYGFSITEDRLIKEKIDRKDMLIEGSKFNSERWGGSTQYGDFSDEGDFLCLSFSNTIPEHQRFAKNKLCEKDGKTYHFLMVYGEENKALAAKLSEQFKFK
ncbi:hypothetical protein [Pleionea sp. CnH1-48]|uniref:hypothetical protein n=1 Tax=Pleionea sp. CnH1-48 TaxID=2954494 RepID=UPI0020983364|nr:hypothetical protein [Pleionea sp. CnH1-48]MCO7224750.1 hypothetical protein [Pleionea sp. CnH1-48]